MLFYLFSNLKENSEKFCDYICKYFIALTLLSLSVFAFLIFCRFLCVEFTFTLQGSFPPSLDLDRDPLAMVMGNTGDFRVF